MSVNRADDRFAARFLCIDLAEARNSGDFNDRYCRPALGLILQEQICAAGEDQGISSWIGKQWRGAVNVGSANHFHDRGHGVVVPQS